MFEVVTMLACRAATPEGPRGPGALARLPYTLEGVCYTFAVHDPAAEPPFLFPEIWLYLRFARTSPGGFTRRFGLRLIDHDNPKGKTRVAYPPTRPANAVHTLGDFPFPTTSPVTSFPVVVRDVVFPRRGRFEFRLMVRRTHPAWRGRPWRRVASHFIAVE